MSEHPLVSESPTGGEAGGLCRCRTSASFQALQLDELKAATEDGQNDDCLSRLVSVHSCFPGLKYFQAVFPFWDACVQVHS